MDNGRNFVKAFKEHQQQVDLSDEDDGEVTFYRPPQLCSTLIIMPEMVNVFYHPTIDAQPICLL